MQPFGTDRVRVAGSKIILHAQRSKGWVARVPKLGTHSEHPGTAVQWDESCYEVISAEAGQGERVTYVLVPWREDVVMRMVVVYDEATEAARAAENKSLERSRRLNFLTRLLSMLAGNLPAPVQNHLARELGVSPVRMTLASCALAMMLFGIVIYFQAGARLAQTESPVPPWLGVLALALVVDVAPRFLVVMLQNRGVGSMFGTLLYSIYWAASPRRRMLPAPFTEHGDRLFMLAPAEDVQRRDELELYGPLLGLLPREDQLRLVKLAGFDYRRNSVPLAWVILFFSILGVVTSWMALRESPMAAFSLLVAAGLAVEQVVRLQSFRSGPAGSVLGFLVRPFVRRLLRRA
jgi:hypothetical protein